MSREHHVRNHHLGGGLAVLVAKDQDAIIAPGAQDTALMVSQEETVEE